MELTEKERKAIAAFEEARPGMGAVAEKTIRNPNSAKIEGSCNQGQSSVLSQKSTPFRGFFDK